MTAEPHSLRRGPLTGLLAELAAAGDERTVRLRELPYLTQVELRVDAETPAVAALAGALRLGPGWYLVVGPPDTAVLDEVRAAVGGSVVDVSAARTVLELTGPHARDVLAHGCSLDLHPRVFAVGASAQTMLAKAQVILHRTGATTYRVFVRVSYADYLARWLLDAMVEYVGAGP